MDLIEKVSKFIKYWYFRYLMVTELYMVESWERLVLNIILMVACAILSYFNCAVVLNATSAVVRYTGHLCGLT